MTARYEAVVIGASAGGIEALRSLLATLPGRLTVPVIVVQHVGAADRGMIDLLDGAGPVRVKEAEEKESPQPGTFYLAPPNYHLLMERDRTFALSVDEKVNHCRPAIDVLFESAADVYGDRLIAVILTGANTDGSLGLKAVKAVGGLAVVQDPERAKAREMPLAAMRAVAADHVAPLEFLGRLLWNLTERQHG